VTAWALIKCATGRWARDEAATLGAALAFYCAFSLAPLLIIVVTITGWIVGAESAYGQLSAQLTSLFGAATAKVLLEAMRNSQDTEGALATVLSIVTLVVGATTVFAALESALERIWRAQALAPTGVYGWLRARILSFGLILAVGFLLLVSLTVSTALSALRDGIRARFEGFTVIMSALDLTISLALITGLIALVYRYLPARRLPWRPVLLGALITAVLFNLGRWLIGLYLGRSTQPSAFGAAASFAAMLLWLYYSAQIFLLGAEFTACLGGVKEAAPEGGATAASATARSLSRSPPSKSRRKRDA
jgi:membrane protein